MEREIFFLMEDLVITFRSFKLTDIILAIGFSGINSVAIRTAEIDNE